MKTIKKAQTGKSMKKKAAKDSVPSEMFPGKKIPKESSNYENNKFAEELEKASVFGKKTAPKKPAPKKKMKNGGSVEKAQVGASLRSGQYKRIGRLAAKNPDRAKKVASRMVERDTRKARGKEYVKKNMSELMPKSASGSKVKKCKYGCK